MILSKVQIADGLHSTTYRPRQGRVAKKQLHSWVHRMTVATRESNSTTKSGTISNTENGTLLLTICGTK